MAKPWTQYLAENENDPERAGRAAAADVADREGENATTRRFKRVYEGLVRAMGLTATPSEREEAEVLSRAQELGNAYTQQSNRLPILTKALAELGLPTDADEPTLTTAAKGLKAKAEEAGQVADLRRKDAARDAADALNWDAAGLLEILPPGTVPEKVTVKVEDKDQEVWAIKVDDKHIPLTERFQRWEPALKRTTTTENGRADTRTDTTITTRTIRVPTGGASGNGDNQGLTKEQIKARKRASEGY